MGAFMGLFQSSIAPHHTTHNMTTRETLLDMRSEYDISITLASLITSITSITQKPSQALPGVSP